MLTRLRLSRFRCYGSLDWEIPAEGAVLVGGNAQGKTSLLEAVCLALTLHSPRASRLDRLAQHGADSFGISLEGEDATRRLVWERGKRVSLRLNGADCADYGDFLADSPPVAWLGNSDIMLVRGAAEERRKYLNFLGAQWHPGYRSALQAYNKALKSRNALLRNPRRNAAALHSYAELLAQHGTVLMQLRERLLNLLLPHISHNHRSISGGSEPVGLAYAPSAPADLLNAIEAVTEADERAGCTTVGPHRDDFLLEIDGAAAADYASEGQQRTLATAMQMAQSDLLQTETGLSPVLLIDDIFGELDAARRQSLLALLPESSQVFITTTSADWVKDCGLPIRRVEGGTVRILD